VGSSHWPWIHGPNWFVCPLLGEGNNLESILLISPVADLSDPISPLQGAEMQAHNSSGCGNHSALHGGMGYSLICFRCPDPTSGSTVFPKSKELLEYGCTVFHTWNSV
jgi:hypothetical protein